jgi:hypothetical protein
MEEFIYEGRTIRTHARRVGKSESWDWSYTIDGDEFVQDRAVRMPSPEAALQEARADAEACIRRKQRK